MSPVALVLWLMLAGGDVYATTDKAACEATVKAARDHGVAASDCVKVELPQPKQNPL